LADMKVSRMNCCVNTMVPYFKVSQLFTAIPLIHHSFFS